MNFNGDDFNSKNLKAKQTDFTKNSGKHIYGRGWLGLIPLIGAFIGFGLIALAIFKYQNRKLALIGVAALIPSVLVYGGLFYYFEYSNAGAKQRAELSKMALNDLAKAVEFYKIQHREYPDSLEQLESKKEFSNIYDPLSSREFSPSHKFNYEKISKGYKLFSSGIDKRPNTADDIYPDILLTDSNKSDLINDNRR